MCVVSQEETINLDSCVSLIQCTANCSLAHKHFRDSSSSSSCSSSNLFYFCVTFLTNTLETSSYCTLNNYARTNYSSCIYILKIYSFKVDMLMHTETVWLDFISNAPINVGGGGEGAGIFC